MPKTLTEVNGRTILTTILENLANNGIKNVAIAVGYCGDEIKLVVGQQYKGMRITYIENQIYEQTNSMYSLWLAKDFLQDGCLIIEGDVIAEEEIVRRALNSGEQSCWISDHFTSEMDGSMQTTDETGRIQEIRIVREILPEYKDNFYKSVGMVKLLPEDGKLLSGWLDQEVKDGNVKIYYDLVFAKYIKELSLHVLDIHGLKWFEIDSINDLEKAEALFGCHNTNQQKNKTKYVIIVGDGMADLPLRELGWKTPLEVAHTPFMDLIAKNGQTGLMQTCYHSLPAGSVVAHLGLLGYNPARFYPNGRASFEALAQKITLDKNDLAFRCNLITLNEGKIADFTASQITNEHAHHIIKNLNINHPQIEIYPGQSYRNLIIFRNAPFEAKELLTFEPHNSIDQNISGIKIKGKTETAQKYAELLNQITSQSQQEIKQLNQNINSKADSIWIWGPSSSPILPAFNSRYGLSAAVVGGMDFLHGIAESCGMEHKKVPGATGYADTNYSAKLEYAKKHLEKNDLVLIHLNGPDEESHIHNIKGKIKCIEDIDQKIVGPMLQHLQENYKDNFKLVLLPDHYTFLADGKHGDLPVPYAIYGKDVAPDQVDCFDENTIRKNNKNLLISYEFMDFLINS